MARTNPAPGDELPVSRMNTKLLPCQGQEGAVRYYVIAKGYRVFQIICVEGNDFANPAYLFLIPAILSSDPAGIPARLHLIPRGHPMGKPEFGGKIAYIKIRRGRGQNQRMCFGKVGQHEERLWLDEAGKRLSDKFAGMFVNKGHLLAPQNGKQKFLNPAQADKTQFPEEERERCDKESPRRKRIVATPPT